MKLCKHQNYKLIDDIWEPKWSTDEVLINVDKVTEDTEHYLIKFTKKSPKNKYGWFYMSGKVIRSHKTQPNGTGHVYVVPMKARETFEPLDHCEHEVD